MNQPARRSRFRLSVRALMVVVLVVGGMLGWKLDRVRTQAQAVAIIKAAGGMVIYDYQFSGERDRWINGFVIDFKAEPRAPKWLRSWLGDEWFRAVTLVEFFQDHPTPEAWQAVSRLDHLIGLSVDAHGRRLGGVTGLRSLYRLTDIVIQSGEIDGPSLDEFVSIPNLRAFEGQFTDEGLEKLTRAKSLVELDIRPDLEFTITEEGLVHLTKLSRLKKLSLFSLKINFSDRSLQILAPILSNLEILHLKSASTSDQGVLLLKDCHRLKSLKIWSDELTDKCFTTMSGLQNLEDLDLHTSSFTDAGLAPLRKLSKLKELSLSGDRLTAAGLELLIPLENLEDLSFFASRLKDTDLEPIRKMRGLKRLFFNDDKGKLAPELVESLKTDVPSLKITLNQPRRKTASGVGNTEPSPD